MAVQLHILFWLNQAKKDKAGKHPLIIRITHKGQRKQVNTPFKIPVQDWKIIQENRKSKSEELNAIKAYMDSFKAKIHTLASKLELDNRFTLDELLDLYNGKGKIEKGLLQTIEEHNERLKERVGIDRAGSTLDKYIYLKDKVRKFLSEEMGKRELPLTRIQSSFIQDFVHFLITKEGNKHNTVAKYCKNLKHVLSFAVENSYISKHPFENYKIGYKDIHRTYLNAEELSILANKQIANKHLEVVRDLFIFQCYTGLAYVDMANLSPDHLTQGVDRKPWLITQRQKTKTQSLIPLLQPALVILEKYREHPSTGGSKLLPCIVIQKFNTHLKELALLCGISKSLSSHAGRRTFATTVALGNGVSLESIAKVLGHSSTKITSIYAVVTDQKLSDEMKDLQSKL